MIHLDEDATRATLWVILGAAGSTALHAITCEVRAWRWRRRARRQTDSAQA